MRSMNFIHGEGQPISLPINHQEPMIGGARRRNQAGRFQSKHAADGNADQQFAADVGQSEHQAAPPVRQRMNRPPLGYFLERLRRQGQPFSAQPKYDPGGLGRDVAGACGPT